MNQNLSSRSVVTHLYGLLACTGSAVRRRAGWLAALALAAATGPAWAGTNPPTIASNTFASTPVGQSLTQTVTLTLNTASAIKSIALGTGTAASTEYKLNSVTGCTVDGATVNASGTVCNLSVTYTPLYAGSLASPRLSRNAQLLYTDASSNVTAYGLSGAATKAIPHVVPGQLNLYAGQPYAVSGTAAADNGLGNTSPGYSGNGVAATSAQFDFAPNNIFGNDIPQNATQPMAYDSQGNLYVIDGPNFIIRKIDNTAQHVITTIAGIQGSQGYTGNGGPATAAKLYAPHAITLDAAGNIYFLDNSTVTVYAYPAQIIRRIDAVTGIITAVAGQNFSGTYDATDGGGTCNLTNSAAVTEYECGDGGLATYAALIDTGYLVLDSAGNFYLSSSEGTGLPVVRKITGSTGVISTIETPTTLLNTTGAAEGGLTIGSDGNLYMIVYDTSVPSYAVVRINPTTLAVTAIAGTTSTQTITSCSITAQQSGIAANTISIGNGPTNASNGDLTSDASGNLYVTDALCSEGVSTFSNAIFRINIAGDLEFTEVIGKGVQSATQATGYNAYNLYYIQPAAAVPDNNGNLYFITYNQIGVLQGAKAALDFGIIDDYQTTAAQTVSYINIGNASGSAPPYSFAAGTNFILAESGDALACDALTSVAVDGVCNLDIAFSPVAAGAVTDTLNVSSGAETVFLTGTGVAQAKAGISPATLAFGNQPINTTSVPQTITITDTGTANLTVENFFINVPNNSDYAVVANGGTCSTSSTTILTPNQSCTVEVTFTPTATGSLPSNFYLNTSVSFSNVATLTGTGTAPPTYTATLSPATLSYTGQPAGATSPAQTVTLTNTGTGTLNISSIGFTGTNASLFADTTTCGSTLAAGANCTIAVTFTPTATGSYSASLSVADNATGSPQTVAITGTATSVTYTNTLVFNPAPVAVSATSAQTLTASFHLNGFATTITPTATLHYGLAYTIGAVSCSGSAGNQTCTVPVTFIPNYPGGRKDAVFLMNGTVRLATILLFGVGQAPFSLIQPGVVTNPVLNSSNYQYGSVVDENGTVYVSTQGANTIETITKAGVVGTLPITGLNSPRAIGIDGAGVIYVADQTPAGSIKTYDTVQGIQGGVPYPSPAFYMQGVTVGNTGNIYATDSTNVYTIPIYGTGTAKTTAISPGNTQASQLVVDSNEDIFIGGYDINEIAAGGIQTQVNTVGAGSGLGVDAAGTLYATRYSVAGVAELPAANYAQYELAVDSGSPLGTSVGPDGTVYVGNYSNVDKVDRTQGNLVFGEQYGTTPAVMTAQIYNGGNMPLSISNLVISSNGGFTQGSVTGSNCAVGTSIPAGSFCNLAISFLSPHAGVFTGTAVVTSNSLNNASTTQTVAFSAFTYGAYVTESPNPLNFGNQTTGTTSAPQTITFTNNGDLYNAGIGNATFSSAGYAVTLGSCSSVGVGATCTATVTFSPTAVQSYNGVTATHSVGSSGGGANTSVSYTLNGTGVAAAAPQAVLNPTSVAFGNQGVGTTFAAQTVTLSNPGTAVLNISGITLTGAGAADFAISANTCGATLAVSGSCMISVTFTPASAASFSAALSVADNVTGSPQTVALTGTGTVAQATLSPTTLAFGNQGVGSTSAAQTVTLSNPGTAALTITSIGLTGAGAADFAISANTCGSSLAAAGSCTISVTFTPASAASFSATLSVADNVTGSPQTVALTGTGTAPQVNLSPGSLAFGNQGVSTTSAAQTVTLSNPGTAALTISSVSITGTNPSDFAISANTCGNSLAAAASCTISVTFTPASAAGFSATLSVADNVTGSPQTVALTGTGTAPQVNLSPTSLAFGNQGVSTTSAAKTVTLSNPGTAALTISSISLTGTNPADFAISANTCGNSLAAAGSCTISVTFTPASAASFTANLSVADNVTGSPQTVALTGTGTAPQVNLSPSTLAFGNQGVSTTSAAQTVTLSNPGTAALTISGVSLTGTNPADFAISANTCGSSLAAAGSCTISVTFTPASAASFSATLSVADNVTGSPQTVTLTGTGTLAQAVLTPATLAFPSTTTGVTSAALTTVLSNPGTAPLTITGITLGGANPADFTLTNGCGSTLAAGASCNLSVTFTPASVASFTGTISVADNVTGSPQTVALSGTGTAAIVPTPVVTPGSIAFGNQNVSTTSPVQTVTLSNTGTGTLIITGITLGGANPTAFTQTGTTCGSTLAAGATCTLSYTFTPTAAGSYSATVSIADNAAGSPQVATLSGTGVATGDFALTGAPATQTVNPGGAASFTINVAALGGGFGLPVTLSVTGLPTAAQASFAPASLTPGTGGGTSVLTVQTSQAFGAVQPKRGPSTTWLAIGMLPCLTALWFGVRRRRGHRRMMPWLAGLALLTVSLGLSSCAGGYFGPPPQSFTLTVTGSSTSTQHSTTVTLTVQ